MSLTDRPIKNLLLPFLALLVALWLRPIVLRLPAPELPKLQLKSLSGTPQANDSCKIIHHPAKALKYCEDLLHWKEAGVAIASCDQGRPEWNTVLGPLKNPEPRGKLFVYDIGATEPETSTGSTGQPPNDRVYELELTGFPDGKDFHPLGLQLHQPNATRSARLFLVNHRRDRSVVEVFKLESNSPDSSTDQLSSRKVSLTWERTLAHNLIETPNAIVALDSNSFLVTNDHYFNRRAHPALHTLETWLTLRGGSVVEVRFTDQLKERSPGHDIDAAEWEDVEAWKTIDGIPFANGIALHPSRSTLVVACSLVQKLWYYHQVKPIGPMQRLAFNPIGSRSLNFIPDNIHFDGPQRLIAAGHPHGRSLAQFSSNLEGEKTAGSSVAAVVHNDDPDEPLNPHRAQIHNILVDDGHFFASSSSAIIVPPSDSDHQLEKTSGTLGHSEHSPNKLIVSGLYQTGLLECNLESA